MGSRDLQNWMQIGTMNRNWFLALPYILTATVDSLSANLLGERVGERWRSGSWKVDWFAAQKRAANFLLIR
jgi:hypothetical protein